MHYDRFSTEFVLGADSESFRNVFEEKWQKHISQFPPKFQKAKQLCIGSRFRPLLVAWGYLLAGGTFKTEHRSLVAEVAVYIELLHKATILIDDIVDGDKARHGQPAFHVEYTDNEAILFAIYLLGDCLSLLSKSTQQIGNSNQYSAIIDLLSSAIKEMSLGGIEEVGLDVDDLGSVTKIKRIIELQTIALVKNGLLTGYIYGGGTATEAHKVESLGHDTGYLFQALNDLEPFFGSDQNTKYKGEENTDISRLRKNLVVAMLFEKIPLTKQKLLLTERSHSSALIESWLETHNILDKVIENLGLVKLNIDRTIKSLNITEDRRNGLILFIDFVLVQAISRLEGIPNQKLSEILIK